MKIISISGLRNRQRTSKNRGQSCRTTFSWTLKIGKQICEDEEEDNDNEGFTLTTSIGKSKSMPATKRLQQRLDLAATAESAAIGLPGEASM